MVNHKPRATPIRIKFEYIQFTVRALRAFIFNGSVFHFQPESSSPSIQEFSKRLGGSGLGWWHPHVSSYANKLDTKPPKQSKYHSGFYLNVGHIHNWINKCLKNKIKLSNLSHLFDLVNPIVYITPFL